MDNSIKCPGCGQTIEITQILREQLEKENQESFQKKLTEVQKNAEDKIRKELEEKSLLEVKELKTSLEEKEQKLSQMREEELKLRETKRKLEEREKDLELETQRKIDEERKKIEYEVLKRADDQHRLKDLEKEKTIQDLKKSLDEAQRKANQGSQQTQGEVLELDLENTLRIAFPNDQIEPVGKGVKGADVRQIVRSPRGIICGTVLWESKRTKAWTDEWLTKLKDDLRAEKSDIPVIVSTTLPKEAESGFGVKDGVWIVNYNLIIPLAVILRKSLLDVGYQKAISTNQGRKADLLYEFITGTEFRQQVEALVEVFSEMQDQLNKEKVAFEKIWKNREGQIKRLVSSTVNIYGGAQGLVGSSMPQIKGLELLESEN